MDSTKYEDIRELLEDVRRTISDNRLFLQQLKRDSANSDVTATPDENANGLIDDFEEL